MYGRKSKAYDLALNVKVVHWTIITTFKLPLVTFIPLTYHFLQV